MKNYKLIFITVASAMLIAGCFGGSSGGGSAPTSNISNVQVSGAATKGIVVDGVVTVEELDSAGNPVATVGNTVTGSDGSYQVALGNNYTGGVLQVTITADANTRMKCDIPVGCGTRTDGLPDSDQTIGFGEFYKPSSLTMTALLPQAEANSTVNASVTPFTHMASQRARQNPVIDSAAVSSANSEVSNLLGGLDILNTLPIDITDASAVNGALSPTQITYAAMLSVVAVEAGADSNGQPLINDALALLAASFSSGTILADDSASNDASQISLNEIIASTNAVFSQIGLLDVTGVLAGMTQQVNNAGAGGIIDPQPSTTAADPTLEKVKRFVSDVRTWGNVIIAEAGAQTASFEAEVQMASDAVGILDTNAIDALLSGIDAALLFNGDPDLSSYVIGVDNFSSGTIGSPSAGQVSITNGTINGYNINMTVALPADGQTASAFNIEILSAAVTGSRNDMNVTTGKVSITTSTAYTINYALPNPLPALSDATVDLDVSFTQKVDSQDQALTSPVTFAGTMKSDLDPVPVTNTAAIPTTPVAAIVLPTDVLVLPKTLELTGALSDTQGNSANITLTANITNTGSFEFVGDFAPYGTLYSANHTEAFASWTLSDTDGQPGNDRFTLTLPDFFAQINWDASSGYAYLWTTNYAYCSPSNQFNSLVEALNYFGTFCSYAFNTSSFVENEGVYIPDPNAGTPDFTMNGTMDGYLVDPDFVIENASQWIDIDVGLTFGLQLTGLPAANVNINADRTGFEAGNGMLSISYGTRKIDVSVDAGNGFSADIAASVTITNQDGVTAELGSLVLSSGNLSGALMYNGNQYGTITTTSSGLVKVSYTDGTFEIF